MPSIPMASTDESDDSGSADDADDDDATTSDDEDDGMLAHPAMTRCLLDTLTLCPS